MLCIYYIHTFIVVLFIKQLNHFSLVLCVSGYSCCGTVRVIPRHSCSPCATTRRSSTSRSYRSVTWHTHDHNAAGNVSRSLVKSIRTRHKETDHCKIKTVLTNRFSLIHSFILCYIPVTKLHISVWTGVVD